MINLMPTDEKRQIRAARINVVLLRYIVIVVCTFLFLLAALLFARAILSNVKASAETVLQNNHVQVQANDQASAQVQQLQASLNNAKTIFDNDVDYTKALSRIAQLVPQGVVLGTLTLSPTSFGTPTTLQALAKTNGGATELQTKLQSSPYFTGVSLQSLSTGGSDPVYPVTATFNLTINRSIAQ